MQAEPRTASRQSQPRAGPATTLAALRIKAEAARALAFDTDGDLAAYAEEHFENNGQAPEALALAITRDLLQMMVDT